MLAKSAVALVVPAGPHRILTRRNAQALIDEECEVPVSEEVLLEETHEMLTAETKNYDLTLSAAPIVSPLVAFFSYEGVARETRAVIEYFDRQNAWFSADGNTYEISILTPVLTGVVMPTLSVALATLAATTISTLRQRQLDVREALNAELCEIALLRTTILASNDVVRGLTLLRDYVSRLILECRPGETVQEVETLPIASNELIPLSALFHGQTHLTGTAQPLIMSLASRRAKRLAEFEATYPFQHYLVLTLCAVAIGVDYLLESDQEILRFLDAVQLRVLWSILIGVFASLASIICDLSDIYRGAFRLTPVVAQLFPLRASIVLDICDNKDFGDSLLFDDVLDAPYSSSSPSSSDDHLTQSLTPSSSSSSSSSSQRRRDLETPPPELATTSDDDDV